MLTFFPKINEHMTLMCHILSRYRQEKGDIKDHECSLIYETKMERNQSTDLNGFDTKVIKFNRLEEINIRYNGSRLGKIAFFECLKKVEKVRLLGKKMSVNQTLACALFSCVATLCVK